MTPRSTNPPKAVRERILEAAFSAFVDKGYAGANTREIAGRAKVSKRELYALFENKQAILAACIARRAHRMHRGLEFPAVENRAALGSTLREYGASFVQEISDPSVTALYRLAVVESDRSPQVARALEASGHAPNRGAVIQLFERAQAAGLVGAGDPSVMASQFFSLLWGDLLLRLLLRLQKTPSVQEAEQRARGATEAVLALYPASRAAQKKVSHVL